MHQLPLTIDNGHGEVLRFLSLIQENGSEKLLVENTVQPKAGPPMHTHFLQEEVLTVVRGKIAYQVLGGEPCFAEAGETVRFAAGVPHRFWNAGEELLECRGFITPPHNIVFFLDAVYKAQRKSGTTKPGLFEGAYLMTRYASEFEMNEIPAPVRKTILPVVYRLGKLLGKYKQYRNAPQPVTR